MTPADVERYKRAARWRDRLRRVEQLIERCQETLSEPVVYPATTAMVHQTLERLSGERARLRFRLESVA